MPPPAVRRITGTLEAAGFETWAVGGAVRDALLGQPGDDWDLATRARPGDVRRLFRRTVPIGVEHGTVGVLADDGVMYEVTTFRQDVETDGRHATVRFADRLEDDLGRRDFTINAVAWHPLRGVFSDPFGGRSDLESRILRAVGRPQERFAEDHLRILRALRFASRFGLTIEPATWQALVDGASRLPALSAERVRDELLKVLEADRKPSWAMELYRTSGALGVLYPEWDQVASGEPRSWALALSVIDALPTGRPLLRLAGLLRALAPRGAAQILMRLKLSNAQVDETARRAAAPPLPGASCSDADFRRWLSAVGPERLPAVARLDLAAARGSGDSDGAWGVVASRRRAREVLRVRPPLTVADLAIDGRSLISLGLRPGPGFGAILGGLLEWVLEDPARNDALILRAEVLRREGERDADG